ncbi:hypothetical protein KFE94_11105 [bacterium SCSIO 12643]|nr:hypothetical protein KFE94_11105 [bacterium SCSIO 12643]
MKSIFILSLSLFIFIVAKAQNDPLKKLETTIEYYKQMPNYLFIQTDSNAYDYQDSILVRLSGNDSVIVFIPILTTYGFVNLYEVTNNKSVLIQKQEGDFSDFLRFTLLKNDYKTYKLEYTGCFSNSSIHIQIIN